MNNIPKTKIGNLEFSYMLGGMGVDVSRGLPGPFAKYGGAGTIASVGLGLSRGYFQEAIKNSRSQIESANPEERKRIFQNLYISANQQALSDEIDAVRTEANGGVVGVNIMYALSDADYLVDVAIRKKVDYISQGAGFSLNLPDKLISKHDPNGTKLFLIVSSGRAADVICRAWAKRGYLPDAFIVEGPMAGGHLGYTLIELSNPEFVAHGLEERVRQVLDVVKKYETSTKKIPVIPAGGLFYGGDLQLYHEMGATGAQIATRAIMAKQCLVDPKFKNKILNCKKEDLIIITSPVGLPGRAIKNNFLDRVNNKETIPISCPYHCIKTCVPENSPYCIAKALVEAQRGNLEDGFSFAGFKAYLCKEQGPTSVEELFSSLDNEARLGIRSQ